MIRRPDRTGVFHNVIINSPLELQPEDIVKAHVQIGASYKALTRSMRVKRVMPNLQIVMGYLYDENGYIGREHTNVLFDELRL